jgi:hypothetical protein
MILVKTDTGQQVFKDRSVRLTPRQRSAFILFDGRRSVGEILAACEGIAQDDVEQMVALGLLGPAGGMPQRRVGGCSGRGTLVAAALQGRLPGRDATDR